ncbi:MAG: hypothetical protein ACXAEI_11460 [Candidatus Hodarchaeales archaeon]|jgi:hypothetical protein
MDSSKKPIEDLIITILSEQGEISTGEIIRKVNREEKDCIDRIPSVLVALKENNRIKRRVSKEKKAIVWSLIE